jgi:lipoprotein NlpD
MTQKRLSHHLIVSSLWLVTLAGCAVGYQHVPAPVEDRTAPSAKSPVTPIKDPPGYYTIRPSDTLIKIGLEHGQNWRDIARWNNIDNPDRIEVGQRLRIVPPVNAAAVESDNGVVVQPISRPAIQVAPSQTSPTSESPIAQPAPSPKPAATASAPTPAPASTEAASTSTALPDLVFVNPARGQVINAFDGLKNKGIDIVGNKGDPVVASADGRVVYAGSGLRGYGNLVILKHNSTYLTAYAHNDKLLVKEDQFVKQGQKIAEMGDSESDRVKLHFEIRKTGKPVDPAPLLKVR